jgi:protein involved in polysaccharide export with SLBB domain
MLQCSVRHFIRIAGLAAAALIWVGCGTSNPRPTPSQPDPSSIGLIPLQTGDQVEVDLTGTPPPPIPPSNFVLSGKNGDISLPLLDTNIPAVGKTPHELEQIIKDLYVPKVFTHITVTVTPGPRFFYVSGAINGNGTGKQLYNGKVTVLKAIGSAGGFNDFAARTRVQLTRQDGTIFIENCKKALKDTKLDLEVFPGDSIFVDKQTPWEAATGQ